MIQFKLISINDKDIITSFTLGGDIADCDLSFANLYCWQFYNEGSYAIVNGQLVLRFRFDEATTVYMPTAWNDETAAVIRLLQTQAKEEGRELILRSVMSKMQPILEKHFPGQFECSVDRNYSDYLYLRQDLVELKGKKLQSKRNHVNRFIRENEYTYIPLTPDILPLCLELESKWCIEHNCDEEESLQNERKALTFALRHFDELGLMGGAICVNEKIVAFTFGSPINNSTFDIQVEKGDTTIEGVYSMINKMFATHIPEQYIYLNREEDLGMCGLRKAKLSYNPVLLLEKGMATMKNT